MATMRGRFGKLVVDFRYLGKRCREKTSLEDNPANRKKLAQVMKKMEAEITLNIFDYAAYFPKSERAQEMTALADRAEACISRNPTFKEFSETFFEERKIEWRPSYRQKIQIILEKYLLPEFGGKAVHAIKKSDLLTFRSSLAKVRYGKDGQSSLSVARINQIMILLRMILEEASDRHEFEMPYKNIKNLKQARPDVNPFTLSEVWLILKHVRADYRPYYTIRFFTGMRTSEIDGLKWDCINFDRREISIRGALVNGEMGPTKTLGSQRDIAMSQLVYDALQEQKASTFGKSEFVFCNSQGNPMEYRNVNRRIWKPTLALLGLKHRRAYQTRHTAATLWLAAGENPEWIARQMGHSSTEMLFRVYSRYVPDITRQDGSAMDNLLLASKEKLTGASNSSGAETLITNAQTDKETSQ
ncbi:MULTISPECIES: tyrosine-type recombinase/integrase [Psychrobacter]|uniref:Phage integrase n=1 Tax=Psychrobacter alimentarius TaxID=261164 RepID=A0ABN4N429_9GAMM|nr:MULTISPECIES: tyrosine-type recombinase/integrase [Psychrobacter]AMT97231.1 Phage integrase [Psychrobacter alimentarius]QCB30444.1 site-specific integrase [Psychrobacter sp. PAMC27889]